MFRRRVAGMVGAECGSRRSGATTVVRSNLAAGVRNGSGAPRRIGPRAVRAAIPRGAAGPDKPPPASLVDR